MESPEKEITQVPEDSFSKVTFHSEQNVLLGSSWDASVNLYNTDEGFRSGYFKASAAVLDCDFYVHADTGIFGGLETRVQMHNFATNQTETLGEHNAPVKCIRFHRESGCVLSGSWDKTLRKWDPRAATKWQSTLELPGKVVTLSCAENTLVTSTNDKQVLVYDLRSLETPLEVKETPIKYQTRSLECMPNAKGYVIASIEGRVGVEYFEMPAKSYSFKCHRKDESGQIFVYPVNALAFHKKFGTFASGGSDCLVNVWDPENKKRLWKLRQYPSPVCSLSFNKEGSQLAIACSYLFEQGDAPSQPPTKLYIREVQDTDVMPKS